MPIARTADQPISSTPATARHGTVGRAGPPAVSCCHGAPRRRARPSWTRSASAISTRPPTAASGMSRSGSSPARARLKNAWMPGRSEAWAAPMPVRPNTTQSSASSMNAAMTSSAGWRCTAEAACGASTNAAITTPTTATETARTACELSSSAIASPASCAPPPTAVAFHSGSASRPPGWTGRGAALIAGPSSCRRRGPAAGS